jgi:periplasmic protein TonB
VKAFLGLGPAAWVASAAVHVGLAGGYALAPAMTAPVTDAPLVVELITLDQRQPPEPAADVAGLPDPALQLTPDLPEPAFELAEIVAPSTPPAVEPVRQVAALASEARLPVLPATAPLPAVPTISKPTPVLFDQAQPDFPPTPAPVAIPAVQPVVEPAPTADMSGVALPREKPPVPERPARYLEPMKPVVEELTLDQIASAAIRPEPETGKEIVPSVDQPLLVERSLVSARPVQIAAVLSPVVVRAARLDQVADPVAVARVKGRGAFQRARPLPVGTVNAKPEYPYTARKRGYEGRVVLHVQVSPRGNPVAVNVMHSTGYKSLDKAATSTVLRWQFEAARRAGVRVPGTVVTPIVFRLED